MTYWYEVRERARDMALVTLVLVTAWRIVRFRR
jgi:hypothetical protein